MNESEENATILVVDDDEGMRELLRTDLELRKYSVVSCDSANTALEVIGENNAIAF